MPSKAEAEPSVYSINLKPGLSECEKAMLTRRIELCFPLADFQPTVKVDPDYTIVSIRFECHATADMVARRLKSVSSMFSGELTYQKPDLSVEDLTILSMFQAFDKGENIKSAAINREDLPVAAAVARAQQQQGK